MRKKFKIGTRGSPLALWQANKVKESLEERYPQLLFELKIIRTKGDKILNSPLSRIGDKGLFTKEIELCLLEGKIDLAVHSLKDLPTSITPGLNIGAVLEREEAEDALISKNNLSLETLPLKAKIATGSLRRKAQLLFFRKDFQIVNIRGNVDTRLRKLENEDLDGLIMAKVALSRLGFSQKITQTISPEILLPAVGQGVLAVEIREDDEDMKKIISFLNHSPTLTAILCERSFLKYLEGGCQIPIGGFAKVEKKTIIFEGMIASLDGGKLFRDKISGHLNDSEKLGQKLARRLLDMGGKEILNQIRGKTLKQDYV